MVKKKTRVPLLEDLFLVLFLIIPFPLHYKRNSLLWQQILSSFSKNYLQIPCSVFWLLHCWCSLIFTRAIGFCRRNLYYLQLRNQFTEGSLSCSKESAVLLASYTAQGNNNNYCDGLLNIVVQECRGLKLRKLGGRTQRQEAKF